MGEVATKKEVETAPEDEALEVRLEEKSQRFGNRLVACTRRCHGQAGGHAGREAGGDKTPGAGEGGREGEREGGFQREVSDEGGLVGGGVWHTVIIMIVIAVC